MYYLIAILLTGVSFAPLIFHKLDMWHAQGLWVQIGVMALFSWSFFEKPKIAKNIPLGLLHLWIGGQTAYICYHGLLKNKYDTVHFFQYFNFLCILILYNSIQSLNRGQIKKILKCLKYVIIGNMLIAVAQYLGVGQFFYVAATHPTHNNLVSGFMGNGTHLSGLLGSCVPLFLMEFKREDKLALILMCFVLCISGTTIGDPAISGWVVGLGTVLYFIRKKRVAFICAVSLIIIAAFMAYPHAPKNFFDSSGRFNLWKIYFPLFKEFPMTGAGLGTVGIVRFQTSIPMAKHLHLEIYHFLIEIGILGVLLIVNIINQFFKIKDRDNLELTLKALIVGFLLSSCFAFPAHLWLPASFGVFFYGSLYAIKTEKTHDFKPKRN